jgi:predicted transposase YdaD
MRRASADRPFDVTTKQLVELHPADWLSYIGLPRGPVEVVNADLATVTAGADRVLRVHGRRPYLGHVEFQSGYEADLGERTLQYSVLLRRRHHLPVRSVIVLLRPAADGPAMTGRLQWRRPDGRSYLTFHYDIVRAWERTVEELLAGGLGTLPLAPLADVRQETLPGVILRMEERIDREAEPGEAGLLWTATYLLMGLRYPRELAARLLRGVRAMKDSVTYQAILEEGETAAARRILLRQGSKRFGPCPPALQATIEGITSVDRLEQLAERLLDAESWEKLLAE